MIIDETVFLLVDEYVTCRNESSTHSAEVEASIAYCCRPSARISG